LIWETDLLDASVEIVRHDSKKLASLIQSVIFKEYFSECEKLIDDPILTQFLLKDSAKIPIKDESVKILGKTAC
jgi:hypothetical protein